MRRVFGRTKSEAAPRVNRMNLETPSLERSETIGSRDAVRRRYGADEAAVVQDLMRLIRFRNEHPAFDGTFTLQDTDERVLGLRWDDGDDWAQLVVDFRDLTYDLEYNDGDQVKRLNFDQAEGVSS